MSNYWNNQLLYPAPELIETMTGSDVLIGTLLFNPVKIIFDSLGAVNVQISVSYDNGVTKIPWKTFNGGSAIVIDDDLYTWSVGTQFYGNGASGDFSIAYLYLKE
jgi:hypothetical protein